MNIVIADDEEIILKWMKKNIEALSPENHVIASCINGMQVLNCCLNGSVDVLFTDIRMPVMDGMELLKKLNQNHVLPYTVVLSAYDDFSYARDCLKLGVSEFLLKSEITKDELEKCLQTAKERIKNNGKAEQKQSSPEEELEKVLLQYLEEPDYISRDAMRQVWNNCCGIRGKYAVFLIRDTDRISNPDQLKEILPIAFPDEKRGLYCLSKNERETVVLAEMIDGDLQKFTENLYETIASFGGINMYISSSDAGKTVEELEGLYGHSRDTLAYQLFYQHIGGLNYETMKKRIGRLEALLEEMFEKLELLINSRKWNLILEEMNQIFDYARKSEPEPAGMKRLFLNSLLNLYWSCLEEADRRSFPIDKIIEVTNCTDIDQLENMVLIQAKEIIRLLIGKQKKYSDSVFKIMQYMEARYAEPVTLDELANHVHMNRSYISHLFKKETGRNINAYLLEFRMEKAKILLESSNHNIQDICCQIGIPDSAYFSKVFKKYTGFTPIEFRRISNEN